MCESYVSTCSVWDLQARFLLLDFFSQANGLNQGPTTASSLSGTRMGRLRHLLRGCPLSDVIWGLVPVKMAFRRHAHISVSTSSEHEILFLRRPKSEQGSRELRGATMHTTCYSAMIVEGLLATQASAHQGNSGFRLRDCYCSKNSKVDSAWYRRAKSVGYPRHALGARCSDKSIR